MDGVGLSLHLITSRLIKGKHGHDASECLMLISVDLNDFILRFQISLTSIKKIYQTLETALNQISNTSKFVKNTLLPVVFYSTLFSVFGGVVKHDLGRLSQMNY